MLERIGHLPVRESFGKLIRHAQGLKILVSNFEGTLCDQFLCSKRSRRAKESQRSLVKIRSKFLDTIIVTVGLQAYRPKFLCSFFSS